MQPAGMGMLILALCVAAVCGYLVGSLNCAIIVSRLLYGKDVRTLGSGNAGMTNVLRNFDKKGAALTMLGDTVKGFATVFIGRGLVLLLAPGHNLLYGACVAAVFVVVGHTFPLYFGFKGGKGIATTLGIMLALQPLVALILLAIFCLLVLVTRMVSLGSVVAISLCPVGMFLWYRFVEGHDALAPTVSTAIIALLALWLHRQNIKRILNGTEYRFGQKKKDGQEAPAEHPGAAK